MASNRRDTNIFAVHDLDWFDRGLRYHSLNYHFRRVFGHRVQKVSVDAGFTCPNVDGTVAIGGCNFCDNRSFSPSRRLPRKDILDQIDDGIRRLKLRYECDHFLAYFQPATNTYAPVEQLDELYQRALSHPRVIGLAIGTRPDCVPGPTLDLMESIARKTYLSLEFGIQTIHDRSLRWMNRGHNYDIVPDAIQRGLNRGFEICAHVILGLPRETHEDMMATARAMASLGIDAIKIHNLYAVKNTPFGDDVLRGDIHLMGRDEYVETLIDFLELLPPSMVVERVSGEAPLDYFIGPSWCLDKPGTLAAINAAFQRRDTWQGKRWPPMQ